MLEPWHTLLRRREVQLAVALSALAAARVLLFSLAFPFFTNVDEHRHVDMVLKYSNGWLPAPGNAPYEPELAEWLWRYGSPEYHAVSGTALPEPVWRVPARAQQRRLAAQRAFLARRSNLEANESPVYYAAAGLWMRLGRAAGWEGAGLLYWVRGLNALATFALCLATFALLGALVPEDRFLRFGVLLLLAVFPQDALYYVTRDALSPLFGGLGFLAVALLAQRPNASPWLFLGVGGWLAGAVLVKYTNLPVLVAAALVTAQLVRDRSGRLGSRGVGVRLLALWAGAAGPVSLWLIRNHWVLGNLSGSAFKIERMGWLSSEASEWTLHPLFEPTGLATFLAHLVPSFWRGELVWYREALASATLDTGLGVTTAVFLGAAAVGLRGRKHAPGARRLDVLALVQVVASVAMLAFMSLLWRFHETSHPSAAHPWFDQGRLIAGTLVPFAVLYVRGIAVTTARLSPRVRTAARTFLLAAVAVSVAASELWLTAPVFASAYNAFHLP